MTQSGAVDHLNNEVVRDYVERLRDVHSYGCFSARGLTMVKARNHPSRNGEQGRGSGVPRFEEVLGEACTLYIHDEQEEETPQCLHCRAEQ